MAFYSNYDPFTILSLLKNISKSEITTISELLENKTSENVHKNVLKLNTLFDTLNDTKTPMNHYDLLYWYCNIKLLTSLLQSSESKIMSRLKEITTHYCCPKCRMNVVINYGYGLIENLEAHNCRQPALPAAGHRAGQPNRLRKLKEYDLHWTVRYRHDIKEKLFFKTVLNKEDVLYLYTIHIMDEGYICLTCDCKISGPNNVIQHVCGQMHLKSLDEDFDDVKIYHQHFANLEPELQILQKEFSLVDRTRTKCAICNKNVLFTGLKNHLRGKCFKKHMVNNILSNKGTPVKYHTLVEITIYKGLLNQCICIDNVQYPLFQNLENKIYCLLCNAIVKNHISLHIESQPHRDRQSSEKAVESLRKYHQIWSSQKVHIQIEQVNFRKREQKITCIVCSNYILYNAKALTDHVESPAHKKCLMNAADALKFEDEASRSHSSSIDVERDTPLSTSSSSSNIGNYSAAKPSTMTSKAASSGSSCSNSPMHTKYPNALAEVIAMNNETFVSGSFSPVTAKYDNTESNIGTVTENISSLDRSNRFPSLFSNTTEAARIVPYDKSVLDELYSDGLLNFTVTIESTKYPTIIKRGTYKHCLVCNVDIPSFVLLHANSMQHVESIASKRRCNLVKKFHDVWVNLPHTDQCRQAFFKAEDGLTCILCDKALDYDVEELKSHIDSWEHVQKIMDTHLNGIPRDTSRVSDLEKEVSTTDSTSEACQTNAENPITTKPISLQDMLNNLKLPSPAKKSENVDEPATQEAETNSSNSDVPTYSSEILDKFYGDAIHYYVRIKDVKYPYIQNMGVYKRCLICNFELISGVLLHVNSAPHVKSTNDAEKMQQLQKYHNLWMSMPVQNQEEQKYFSVGEKLMCVPCRIELEYDVGTLTSHLTSAEHVNKMIARSSVSFDKLEKSNAELHGSSSNVSTIAENSDISQLARYDNTVMESVYLNLTKYTVLVDGRSYLCLQNRHESVYCLACRESFILIDNHVATIQHLSRIRDQNILRTLKNFHDNFLSLSPALQTAQIYFHPKKMVCMLCGVSCPTLIYIISHLTTSKAHAKNVKKRELFEEKNYYIDSKNVPEKTTKVEIVKPDLPVARFPFENSCNTEVFNGHSLQYIQNDYQSLQEHNCVKYYNYFSIPEISLVAYKKPVIESIYSNLTHYAVVVDNVLYPYIQNKDVYLFCLICEESLPNIDLHVKSKKHTKKLKDQKLLNAVKFFHEQFLPLTLPHQMEQIYFIPKKLTCLLCQAHCYTSANIVNHIDEEGHKNQVETREKIYKTYSLCDINKVLFATYDKTVMESIYLNLTQYTVVVNNVSYPCIQNRDQSLFCLLCRKPLTDADYHINSIKHKRRLDVQELLNTVKSFHEQFLLLSPPQQMEQIYFLPKKLTCLLCGIHCLSSLNIVDHICGEQHKIQVEKREKKYEANSLKVSNTTERCSPVCFLEELNQTQRVNKNVGYNWQDEYHFSQESNAVKYYIYSTMQDTSLAAYDNTVMESIYLNLTQYTLPVAGKLYLYLQNRLKSLFCLICRESLTLIDNHIESEEHLEKIRHAHSFQLLKQYHEQFLSLPPALQIEQINFHPTRRICSLCGIRCPTLEAVIAHLGSREHAYNVENRDAENASTTKIASSVTDISFEDYTKTINENPFQYWENNYRLSQEPNCVKYYICSSISEIPIAKYDKTVMDSIYSNLTQYTVTVDNVLYPYIQRTDIGLFCLICQKPLSNINHHVNSKNHTKKLKDRRLLKTVKYYHDQFLCLSSSQQMEQIYFVPEEVTCLLCTAYCHTSANVIIHISEEGHRKLVQKREKTYETNSRGKFSTPERLRALNETKAGDKKLVRDWRDEYHSFHESNSVTDTTIEDIDISQCDTIKKFNDFLRNANRLDVDIVRNLPSGQFICLICQTDIKNPFNFSHISSDHHRTKLASPSNIDRIRIYYDEWKRVDSEFIECQDAFIPVTRTITFCITCGINLQYTQLNEHLTRFHASSDVSKLLSAFAPSQYKLDPDFYFPSQKEYCQKVQKSLYRENIQQCDLIMESISYPVIQNLDKNIRCLLCYKSINGDKFAHLCSKEHIANVISHTARNKLKNYHDTWMDGDESFQMEQMYFEKDREYYCKICLVDVKVIDLLKHINGAEHKASLKEFLSDRCILKDAQSLDTNLSLASAENAGSSQGDDDFNTESDTDDSNDVPTQYPKHILEELYVDYKKYHVNINGMQYPIFRKTVIGVKCMICKRSPDVPSIEQHVALERHQNRLTARTGQNKLRKFHDAWMKLDPSIQIYQQYFHVIKCILCDVQVDYDNITAHVQNDICEKKMELFNMAKTDNACSLSVVNTLNNSKQNLIDEVSTPHKNEKKKADKPKSVNSNKNAHDVRKAIANGNSKRILNAIPLRYSKHVKFLTDESDDLYCKCCCLKLKKEISIIKEHLDSANHLLTSNVPKRKMKYYCEICNKRYGVESSWDKHLVDLAHLARFDNLGKTRKERITEYECLTCDTVVFGNEISLRRNCASSSKKKKAKELVLPKAVKNLFASRQTIDQTLEKLLSEADEASQNQDKEREVCLALVRALKEMYPKCKAYPFGSRVTGLGYVDSDLDVFLDIGGMYYGDYLQDPDDQADIVKTVAKILQKQKSFSDIFKVAGARTPIVQVFHKDTGIDCDISFKHGLSVENTAFIRLCLDLQPVLRPTMLYIKEWYATTNIHGISSYALTILMIFYLQTKGYLLSIRELRRINPEKSYVIDGWDTIKHTASLQKMKEYVTKCDYNVTELMESFFEYYAKFDFPKWVICPLMGYLIVKPDFNGLGENLPMEMQKYKEKLGGKNPECFRNLTPMCVQDPFDLSHNLTKACSHETVKIFQGYCNLSKNHLSALN